VKEQAFPAKRLAGLHDFLRLIEKFAGKTDALPSDIIEELFEESGLRAYLAKSDDGEERIANIEELITAAVEFEQRNEDTTIAAFLKDVALLSSVDTFRADSDARVVLMTLHCAKGLEFDTVFITGCEENLLPHRRSLDEGGDRAREEERRLFYVGMTRAKRRLILTSAKNRRFGGTFIPALQSSFLDEIPDMLLDVKDLAPYSSGGKRRKRPAWHDDTDAFGAGQETDADSDGFVDDFVDEIPQMAFELEKGDRVHHHTFGAGVVEEITGSGLTMKATVSFTFSGTKKLSLQHAKLKKLS